MKHGLLVLAVIALVGCRSPESKAAWEHLEEVRNAAMADGVVTTEEAQMILAAAEVYAKLEKEAASSFDWQTFLASIASSIVLGGAAIKGIGVAPLLNKRDAAKGLTTKA